MQGHLRTKGDENCAAGRLANPLRLFRSNASMVHTYCALFLVFHHIPFDAAPLLLPSGAAPKFRRSTNLATTRWFHTFSQRAQKQNGKLCIAFFRAVRRCRQADRPASSRRNKTTSSIKSTTREGRFRFSLTTSLPNARKKLSIRPL